MAALQPKMCLPDTLEKAPLLITTKTGAPRGRGKVGVPRPTHRTSGEGCEPTLLLLQTTHSELQQGLGTDRFPTPEKSYQDQETFLADSLSMLLQHEPLPNK